MDVYINNCPTYYWTNNSNLHWGKQTSIVSSQPHRSNQEIVLMGKFLYIQSTPQLFSSVSIPNKGRQTSAPNSHTCRPSTDKIPSQKYNRKNWQQRASQPHILTKGLFSFVSLCICKCNSKVFNGVQTKQGKIDQRAQQSQVQTLNRLNTKSTIQEEKTVNKEQFLIQDQPRQLLI